MINVWITANKTQASPYQRAVLVDSRGDDPVLVGLVRNDWVGCETGVVNGTSRKNPQYTAPAALLSVLDVIIFVPRRSRGTAPTRPDARKAEARNATEKCMMLVVKLDWTGTTSRVNKGILGSQGRALLCKNE